MAKIFNSRPVLFLIVASIVLAAFFRQELYAFFFSPDGLSLAKNEICVINDSNKEPIVKIVVDNGATMTGLLFAGERLCSPSPYKETSGYIKVSLEDGSTAFCDIKISAGGNMILLSYDGKELCEWDSQ